MVEIIPNVISDEVGEEIERFLAPHVEGSAVLAKTNNPQLKELAHIAVQAFSDALGVNPRKTVSVFELYKPQEWRKVAHHIHTDGVATATLGISSDLRHNAGTVVLEGNANALLHRYYSEVFRPSDSGEHVTARLNEQYERDDRSIAQAPRFGALIIPPLVAHTAPYLPEDTARLLLITAP